MAASLRLNWYRSSVVRARVAGSDGLRAHRGGEIARDYAR